MSLALIKKLLDSNEKPRLESPLSVICYKLLKEEITEEEAVEEGEELALSSSDLTEHFGPETSSFLTALVCSNADVFLATTIYKLLDEEHLKEEIAFEYLQYGDLIHSPDCELFALLLIDGFLSPKEKTEHLNKANDISLLILGKHFHIQKNKVALDEILEKMSVEALRQFVLANEVQSLSKEIFLRLKSEGLISSKEVPSILRKVDGLSEDEIKDLLSKVVEDEDFESALVLTIQGYSHLNSKLLELILDLSPLELKDLTPAVRLLLVDYALANKPLKVLSIDKKKVLTYKNKIIVEDESSYLKNQLSTEAFENLKALFKTKSQQIPDVIKGKYNLKTEEFLTSEAFDLSLISYEVKFEGIDHEQSLALFKPDILVPSTLKKVDSKLVLEVYLDEVQIPSDKIHADSIEELREIFKKKIENLQASLKDEPISSRYFGVELEVCLEKVAPGDIAMALEGENLWVLDPEDETTSSAAIKSASKSWSVKNDISVNPRKGLVNAPKENFYAAEIISPKLQGEEGLEELRSKITQVIEECGEGVYVNGTCGLHVHHDLRELFSFDRSQDQEVINLKEFLKEELARTQDSLYNLCAESRRDNPYCPRLEVDGKKVKQPNLDRKDFAGNDIRRPRPGFNLETGYGTLEFRMHEATLDVEQIVSWVRITNLLVESAMEKYFRSKKEATSKVKKALMLMESEKILKIYTYEDLESALREINEFLSQNARSKVLSGVRI